MEIERVSRAGKTMSRSRAEKLHICQFFQQLVYETGNHCVIAIRWEPDRHSFPCEGIPRADFVYAGVSDAYCLVLLVLFDICLMNGKSDPIEKKAKTLRDKLKEMENKGGWVTKENNLHEGACGIVFCWKHWWGVLAQPYV